jgi:superfamily II DNA or RNA helicase
MELRNYQKEIVLKTYDYIQQNDRCCVSLATGGGKTVIFSELVKYFKGRILICVHREELVHQTSNTLTKDHDLLIPKIKEISKDVCIAMVQTLNNRIKKGLVDVNSFDFLIIDECHRGEFIKILDKFKGKVIGFTATPNYEKNRYFYKCFSCGESYDESGECCKKKTEKFREKIPLSRYYNKLINGIEIADLIEQKYLVKDENFKLEVDTSRLVYDEFKGDYTEESITLVFGSDEAIENTCDVYEELALNKKTIIFNANTIVNRKLFDKMTARGHNVKMYDSVNSQENRHDLIEWFKNTSNAILLNVQVFTTGFDCTDVEVIFLNKKTQSLNLFLQMVGRGGRITDKIFKPSFRVIDMGNNVNDLGAWSDKRDWKSYFYATEIKKVGTPTPSAVRTCHSCESIISANSLKCEVCGVERQYKGGVSGLPVRDGKPFIPTPKQIVDYCLQKDLDCLDARKIVYNYVACLFEGVSAESFFKHKSTGTLFYKTKQFIKPYYFKINRSDLKGNKVRTIESFTNETIKQIERRYITGENL